MNERYRLLEKNDKLIWNFRDISHTMRQTSEGKGSQKRILILLWENKGMTQRELTQRLGIQPGSVSEVISKLESTGLIVRTPSKIDHRTTDIRLTQEGETLAQDAHFKRKERHEQMFAVLSEQEKDTLISLLERINKDWDQKYRTGDGE